MNEADCQVTPAAQPDLQPVHGFSQAQSHTKFHMRFRVVRYGFFTSVF